MRLLNALILIVLLLILMSTKVDTPSVDETLHHRRDNGSFKIPIVLSHSLRIKPKNSKPKSRLQDELELGKVVLNMLDTLFGRGVQASGRGVQTSASTADDNVTLITSDWGALHGYFTM